MPALFWSFQTCLLTWRVITCLVVAFLLKARVGSRLGLVRVGDLNLTLIPVTNTVWHHRSWQLQQLCTINITAWWPGGDFRFLDVNACDLTQDLQTPHWTTLLLTQVCMLLLGRTHSQFAICLGGTLVEKNSQVWGRSVHRSQWRPPKPSCEI